MDQKTEEFYKRLAEELERDSSWPSEYLFKFIVPASLEKTSIIERSFDGTDAKIATTDSKSGKFTSLSIRVTMNNPESVVQKYVELSTIEGLMSF